VPLPAALDVPFCAPLFCVLPFWPLPFCAPALGVCVVFWLLPFELVRPVVTPGVWPGRTEAAPLVLEPPLVEPVLPETTGAVADELPVPEVVALPVEDVVGAVAGSAGAVCA